MPGWMSTCSSKERHKIVPVRNIFKEKIIQIDLNLIISFLDGRGTSTVKSKKTLSYCTNVGAFMQNLRPGRTCKSDQ